MPIRTQSDLPAKEILEKENIFVMDERRAMHQDIRPIGIAILNLMPLKEEAELQLLRSLSNTPLQVDITFLTVTSDSPALCSEPRLAIILGTEGDGLCHEAIANADYVARIPMMHGVDSLNVAAASAVAFWQLRKR